MGEDLLPGLVRVIEERLGPFGRPLSTLVIISAALGVAAWGIHQVVDKIVRPVVRVLPDGAGDVFSIEAVQSVGGIVAIVIGTLVAEYVYSKTRRKREQKLQQEIEGLRNRLDDAGIPSD